MSVTDGEAAPKTERIQDFIFSRELAEVYLLLDFVSGRSDKSLATAFDSIAESEKNKDGVKKTGQDFIEEICQIPWPPTDGQPQPAKAAARTHAGKGPPQLRGQARERRLDRLHLDGGGRRKQLPPTQFLAEDVGAPVVAQ